MYWQVQVCMLKFRHPGYVYEHVTTSKDMYSLPETANFLVVLVIITRPPPTLKSDWSLFATPYDAMCFSACHKRAKRTRRES